MHKTPKKPKKPKEDVFPTHGGNDSHHDHLCALECLVIAQGKKLSSLTARITRGERTMANLAEQLQALKDEIVTVKADVVAEKAEVQAKLADLAAQIKALQDQVVGGGQVTAQDLEDLRTSVTEIGTGVKEISEPPAV